MNFDVSVADPVQAQKRVAAPDTNPNNKTPTYVGLSRGAKAGLDDPSKINWALCRDHVHLRASHPIDESHGADSFAATLWAPLMTAPPDFERRDLIVMGSSSKGREYVDMMRHYCDTFSRDGLMIPPTCRPLHVRNSEVRNGKIAQSNCLWDVLRIIRQAGFWLSAPSLCAEEMLPGPRAAFGRLTTPESIQNHNQV